jgi:hypothetical protein
VTLRLVRFLCLDIVVKGSESRMAQPATISRFRWGVVNRYNSIRYFVNGGPYE